MLRHFLFIWILFPVMVVAQSEDSNSPEENPYPDSLNFAEIDWTFEDLPLGKILDSIIWDTFHSDTAMAIYNFGEDSIIPAIGMDSIIRARIAYLDAQTPFSLQYTTDVHRFINLYLRRHEMISRMLGLAEFYFPLFEETLDRFDMPLELKYLAIVESALNARARSRMGAQGLWQFMYNTGKIMDLEINSLVDERNDPYKSTVAACAYLHKMYDWFGDWNMALAAYNAGPGNVRKAIRRSGGKDSYWEIRPFLPRETQSYVPAFIAVNYVMHFAGEHGITPTPAMYSYFQVDSVQIRETLSFEAIAKAVNLNVEQIEALNPMYRKGLIPAGTSSYNTLVLPLPHLGVFLSNEDSIYKLAHQTMPEKEKEVEAEEVERVIHRVRSGENLSIIASRYKVGVSQIKQWNNLRSDRIYVGQRLQLQPKATAPASNQGASMATVKVVEKVTDKDQKEAVVHRVQIGDTLYDIAARYPGISAEDIMKWNNIQNPHRIKTGDKIKIYTN
ncbi:MAG: LysM peptidoglycan-binding domain-containing protein [Cryomorphaceae bacterium]|nr:LysM peptidoglycan-binding domain-containing protein [Cryomorphaceae bacterium]